MSKKMGKWYKKILSVLGWDSNQTQTSSTPISNATSAEALTPTVLKAMARGIVTTRDEEMNCAECYAELDRFVELNLAGKDAAAAMPLVQEHLARCRDCREEFEALLAALRAMA